MCLNGADLTWGYDIGITSRNSSPKDHKGKKAGKEGNWEVRVVIVNSAKGKQSVKEALKVERNGSSKTYTEEQQIQHCYYAYVTKPRSQSVRQLYRER